MNHLSCALFFTRVCLVLSTIQVLSAQEGEWVDYLIRKEHGIMSVSTDMSLQSDKPNYPNLLIVGIRLRDCLKNGFPDPEGLDKLFRFSDDTFAVIDSMTKNTLTAIITYRCQGYDVYYVKDTLGLRKALTDRLNTRHNDVQTFLTIKDDKAWDYYYNQLYPQYFSLSHLMDHEYLNSLVIQGDDLSGMRKVRHWLYFKNLKNRNKTSEKLKRLKFSLDSINYRKGTAYPFELQISRKDSVNPVSVYEFTTLLKILCSSNGGIYDGWSTELQVKE